MEAWEVLNKAIPKGKSGKVAMLLGVSADYVRRWRRDPDDESPSSTGQRSILDRVCDLIDVVYLVNPGGCALIVEHISGYYNLLLKNHAQPIVSHACGAAHISEILHQSTDAVNHLNIEGCTPDTLTELVELRDATDRAIQSVRKTMNLEAEGSAGASA